MTVSPRPMARCILPTGSYTYHVCSCVCISSPTQVPALGVGPIANVAHELGISAAVCVRLRGCVGVARICESTHREDGNNPGHSFCRFQDADHCIISDGDVKHKQFLAGTVFLTSSMCWLYKAMALDLSSMLP